MTLSVLVDFGNGMAIRNPSAEIESDPESFADVVSVFRGSPAQYFCPHCYAKAGVMTEVRFRAPQQRRVHFYHKTDSENKGCPYASKESDWHINAKAAIAESLKVQGLFQDVRQEWWMKAAERRPDIIAVYPNGAIEAHEVQISPISVADLKYRTEDLRTRGNCAKVVWYLGKGAFTPENRRLLRSLANVECYRLAFPSQDADFPEWQLDDRAIPSPAPENPAIDKSCSTKIDYTQNISAWLKKYGHKKSLTELAIGARVRGIPGRVSETWTGVIVGNEPFKDGRDYWQVRWHDREFGTFPDKSINKCPVIGSLSEHLEVVA